MTWYYNDIVTKLSKKSYICSCMLHCNAKSLTQTARTIIVWLEPMDHRQVTITHLPFALSVADYAPLLGEDKYVVVGPATRACG